MVIVYTGGRIGGRFSGGDFSEGDGGLAVPDLRSIKLGVSAPANGHTGTGKGEVLLERFVGVARNSARNMHARGLCET